MESIIDEKIKMIENRLNNRPRKRLKFRTDWNFGRLQRCSVNCWVVLPFKFGSTICLIASFHNLI